MCEGSYHLLAHVPHINSRKFYCNQLILHFSCKLILSEMKIVRISGGFAGFPQNSVFSQLKKKMGGHDTGPRLCLNFCFFCLDRIFISVLLFFFQQLSPTIQSSESVHEHGLEQTLFDRLMAMVCTSTSLDNCVIPQM